jgi:P-type Cu2+ transporter
MASGTSISKTASDAVLLSTDLKIIEKTIKLARKAKHIVVENLAWAAVYNITAIPFAMAGLVPAWLAALGMSFSSLIVVLNSLRLRKSRKT